MFFGTAKDTIGILSSTETASHSLQTRQVSYCFDKFDRHRYLLIWGPSQDLSAVEKLAIVESPENDLAVQACYAHSAKGEPLEPDLR